MAADKQLPQHDALVVGTGFAGLYALHLLANDLKLDVKAVETAPDVGGTWYWNRYPGARSDVESHVYRYSWDKELLQASPWKHNYLTQPELLEYFREVARRHDLNRHIQFETSLVAAEWDDGAKLWTATLSTGEVLVVRYLVTGIGLVHKKYIPEIPGLDTFQGQVTHSSAWSEDIQHEGKRVAVIGTGASGVQLVGALGEKAGHLTQFIRHAQYVLPAALREISPEERERTNAQYDRIWRDVFASTAGFGFPEPARPLATVAPADRELIFQDLWDQGSGFRFLFGGFSDLATDEFANKEAIRFIHGKIAEIVKDPRKAEVLTSSDWFARRPLTDDKYYERFNQENVDVVDLKQTPITGITSNAIETADGKKHEVDLIVFATGFDAIDGSYYQIDFKGRGGTFLKEHWADAPKTHHGTATPQFPNLLFVNGPGAPFSNNPPASEESARFVADLIAHAEEARKAGTVSGVIESSDAAAEAWLEQSRQVADATLFPKANSWFFGENIPGRKVAPRLNFGGLSRYRAALADNRSKGFDGFTFDG